MNLILRNRRSIFRGMVVALVLIALSACESSPSSEFNETLQLDAIKIDDQGRFDLSRLQGFNGKNIADYQIELTENPDNAYQLIPANQPQYLVPLNNAPAQLTITQRDTQETFDIAVTIDPFDDLFENFLRPNVITDAAFSVIESNNLVSLNQDEVFDADVRLETVYEGVLVYRNDQPIPIGVIGTIDLGANNATPPLVKTMTLTKPGRYKMVYYDASETRTESPEITLRVDPPTLTMLNDFVAIFSLSSLSSLQIVYNGERDAISPGNQLTDIGENVIDVGYEEDRQFISVLDEPIRFNIQPRIRTSRPIDFEVNQTRYEIDRPLTLEVRNTAQEIRLNNEVIQDNEVVIRSVGENTLTIQGTNNTEYEYTFVYQNELQEAMIGNWMWYLGAAILAGALLVIKVPKAVR